MSIYMQSDYNNGVHYWQFGAQWTWDEFYSQFARALEELEAEGQRFDIVLDFSQARKLPPNFLYQVYNCTKNPLHHLDSVVVIAGFNVRSFLDALTLVNRTFMSRATYANNRDQALQVINEQRRVIA